MKRFKQQRDVQYFDTYSLVLIINSIPILIAFSIINKFEIHQINIKTTFLNDDLDEQEVYMIQLEGAYY